MRARFLPLLALLFATQAYAKDYPAIERMVAFNDLAMMVTDLGIQGDTAPAKDVSALTELKKNIVDALKEAKGDRDLTAAVKSYYVDVESFYDGVDPQAGESVLLYRARMDQLETQAKRSTSSLKLELTTRGASI
jgi:hypothetical protein